MKASLTDEFRQLQVDLLEVSQAISQTISELAQTREDTRDLAPAQPETHPGQPETHPETQPPTYPATHPETQPENQPSTHPATHPDSQHLKIPKKANTQPNQTNQTPTNQTPTPKPKRRPKKSKPQLPSRDAPFTTTQYDVDDKQKKPERTRSGKSYFDDVLKRIRERRRRVQISDEEAQIFCRSLVERMIAAAEQDGESVKNDRPAFAKLKMLSEIDEICKPAWRHWCINEGVAVALASWLATLPDGSLPNLSVRQKVLQIALQLPFQPGDLRDNDLGKVIVGLWRHPEETEGNRRVVREIVGKWVRPMLGLRRASERANE